jgi:hypothetical protein
MPRIVIKGKDLPRAQFLNSQITNNMSNTGAPPGINMWSANPQQSQQAANPIGWSPMMNNYLNSSPQTTFTTTLPPSQFNYGKLNKQDRQQLDLARQSAQAQGIKEGTDFGVGRDKKGNLVSYQDPKEAQKSNEDYANKPNFFDKLGAWGNRTQKNLNRFYNALDPIHTVLGAFDLEKKRRNSEQAARLGYLPDNRYAVTQQTAPDIRGGYNVNTGGYGQQGDYTVNQGQLTNATGFMPQRSFYNESKMGGEQGPLKIRITRTPDENIMAYGGQARHSLDLRRDALVTPNISYENAYEVTDTLKPVPRDEANVEAEKGETVFGDLDGDGGLEHMKIGGKRHHEGGTPLNLPTGAFIYSDTQKMSIKDEEVLAYFSLKPKKGGYTPAEIAKRYDINKYKAMLEDPEADDLKKATAQQMITAYNKKLAYLALIQESMKGFPQGIPEVAKEILGIEMDEERMSSEEEIPQEQMSSQEQPEEFENQQGQTESAIFRYGGEELPKAQDGITNINRPYSKRASNRGTRLDYDPVGYSQYANDEYWNSQAAYDTKWKPYVQSSLSDSSRRDQIINNLRTAANDSNNPNKRAISYHLGRALSSSDPSAYLLNIGTDNEIGPFHQALRNAMQITTPTTQAPVPSTLSVTGYICDANGVPKAQTFASNDEMKKAGAVSSDQIDTLPCFKSDSKIPEGKTTTVPFRPLKPDVLNRMAAGLFPPKNYQIPIMKPAFTPERVKLYDPRQALAENQSLYNTTMGALGSMGDVRTLNSMAGGLQGKALASAASILGDYQDKNVGVVNQALARNAEAQRQYDKEAADLATQTGFVNRDTDVFNRNQWRQYTKGIRAADTALWNNAVKMGLINATNKYNIDPWTGQVTMKPGTPGSLGSGYTDGYGTGAHFRKMQQEFPGLTYDQYFSPKMQSAFKKSDESDPMLPYLMSGAFAGPYGSS